jgi:hypothetical protein
MGGDGNQEIGELHVIGSPTGSGCWVFYQLNLNLLSNIKKATTWQKCFPLRGQYEMCDATKLNRISHRSGLHLHLIILGCDRREFYSILKLSSFINWSDKGKSPTTASFS